MTPSSTRAEKIAQSMRTIREAYYRASVIGQLVNVRDSLPDEQNFLKLGRRTYIPEEWYSRDDIYYDLALQKFGENIAFSEKKHIIEEILKDQRIRRIPLPEVNAASFREQIDDMPIEPEILIAPVDYFVKLVHDWPAQDNSFRVRTFDRLQVSNHVYNTFWSNRYIPFKEFIFISKNYGEWVAKPCIRDRFHVELTESNVPGKLELLIFTAFKFSILEPNEIMILQQVP